MSRMVVTLPVGALSLTRTGEGPDLVVLHSLLTDRHAFDPVVPALAERWRVNLVDLPGFGESTGVDPTIDAYADAVGGLLAAGDFDPSTTAVMGNGLGAFVGLGAAVRHGDRFERLVLVGCGLTFAPGDRQAFTRMAGAVAEGGMEAVVEVAVRRIYPEAHLDAHPELVEERRRVLLATDPDAFVNACRALGAVDYRPSASSIRNPTLIVVGTVDGPTPPALAREAHAGIAGSQLVELDGVGHAPQLQDPERLLGAVAGFL